MELGNSEQHYSVIQPSGEIDLTNVAELEAQVREALASRPGDCIIDLSRATFIDSSVVRVLLIARQLALAADGTLSLVVDGGIPGRVVSLARLDRIPGVRVLRELEEALEALTQGRAGSAGELGSVPLRSSSDAMPRSDDLVADG